jgi:hypothetical protein
MSGGGEVHRPAGLAWRGPRAHPETGGIMWADRARPPHPGVLDADRPPIGTPKQLSGIGLPPLAGEQPQAGLHDLALGPKAACCHCLGQERVVDIDAGAHGNIPVEV